MANSLHVYVGNSYSSGKSVTPEQMQSIAQQNKLDSHATYGKYQNMAGLKVTLGDLLVADLHGRHGYNWFKPQLMGLAADIGAVIQHPGDSTCRPGDWSPESFFVYPTEN